MPANAAVYLPYEKVDIKPLFPGTKSDKSLFRSATYYDVPLNGEIVRFNIMPQNDLGQHLHGFLNYVASLSEEERRKQDASRIIRHTKVVLGLVAESEFDDNPAIWESLFKIADAFDGYILVYDSLLTAKGGVIFGPLKDSQ